MVTIHDKYDKKEIQKLPRALFDGKIVTIISEQEAEKAVDFLMKQQILGFDTETRPCFKKGHTNLVALLQVSTHDICFLFRLNRIGLPDCLKRLLEDCSITKVGLSLQDDLRVLSHRSEFTPGTFIELQKEVRDLGIEDMSLQKIFANLFGEKIAKNQQLSNWEAESLTEAQQLYAATDAWACIRIHEEIKRLKATGDYALAKTPAIEMEPKAKAAGE
ncbi:MAG: 3'-5' exonuclease domain-containing protein 2 [Bacteroidaceae bacterium]|nr:3'-5' exonuclease domain-containing protein 2 [Bacteroidaceae bacterium]